MSRRLSTRLARVVAVLAAGASALGALALASAPEGCADKAPSPSAPPPIVVGVSFGLTGSLDTFTAPLRDAVRAAEGTVNAAGGVLGRPVRFEIVDDRSDEGEFVQNVAREFVRKRVVAVIGPISSQQVVLTHEIYQQAGIVQISPSATSTVLTNIQDQGNRFLFRTTPADDFQGAAVILFARLGPRGITDAGAPIDSGTTADGGAGPITICNKLAIVHIDQAYGNSMADVIEQKFPARGGTVVIRKRIPNDNNQDFAAVSTEIIARQPDCLAMIAYDDVGVPLVRAFRAAPGYAQLEQRGFFFIGTDGVYTSGFLVNLRENAADETSKNAGEGVYGTNPDTQPLTREYSDFKTIYSAYAPLRPGTDAPAFAANTFDAAILIALAVQKAGNTDGIAVRNALREISTKNRGRSYTPAQIGDALIAARDGQGVNYKGASGDVDFDPSGNVTAGFIVWQAFRDPVSKKVDYRTVARFTTAELEEQIR